MDRYTLELAAPSLNPVIVDARTSPCCMTLSDKCGGDKCSHWLDVLSCTLQGWTYHFCWQAANQPHSTALHCNPVTRLMSYYTGTVGNMFYASLFRIYRHQQSTRPKVSRNNYFAIGTGETDNGVNNLIHPMSTMRKDRVGGHIPAIPISLI